MEAKVNAAYEGKNVLVIECQCINRSQIIGNRYINKKYRLARVLRFTGVTYSLQTFRYCLFQCATLSQVLEFASIDCICFRYLPIRATNGIALLSCIFELSVPLTPYFYMVKHWVHMDILLFFFFSFKDRL